MCRQQKSEKEVGIVHEGIWGAIGALGKANSNEIIIRKLSPCMTCKHMDLKMSASYNTDDFKHFVIECYNYDLCRHLINTIKGEEYNNE